MTCSQNLMLIQDNDYEDEITVTDVPAGQFLAVISNTFTDGADTREVTVKCMELQVAPGGTQKANSGLYRRQTDETMVKTRVLGTDGTTVLCENTQAYS